MADPNGSRLELRHINQIYGGGEQTFIAIQDVTLALNEGEFATLMGPTGCGKSTLLRIITGLQTPTAGEVLYRGKPLRGVNPHSTIVFQTFALFPWLTVQENVEVALKARDVLSAEPLRGELMELWTGGVIPTRAILMATHNIEEAVFLADRILVMDKDPGRLIMNLQGDLPHPRQRKDPKFLNLIDRVYMVLAGHPPPAP